MSMRARVRNWMRHQYVEEMKMHGAPLSKHIQLKSEPTIETTVTLTPTFHIFKSYKRHDTYAPI